MVGSAKRLGTPKKKRSSADRAMIGSAKRSGSGTVAPKFKPKKKIPKPRKY